MPVEILLTDHSCTKSPIWKNFQYVSDLDVYLT